VTAKARTFIHQLDVIGLGFRVKRPTRRIIADMIEKKGGIAGMRLVREPDNPADSNAIMVCMPTRLLQGMQIGYVRRPTAEILAPKIDNGSLTVKGAVLAWLSPEDDYKEGSLDVTFRQMPKSS
jgi:hypothetical protein